MEEKNIALCILGVIAIIAIVGLILLFTAQQAGAVARTPYPGGVVAQPVVDERPGYGVGPGVQYYTSSGEPVVEPANIPYYPQTWKVVEGRR